MGCCGLFGFGRGNVDVVEVGVVVIWLLGLWCGYLFFLGFGDGFLCGSYVGVWWDFFSVCINFVVFGNGLGCLGGCGEVVVELVFFKLSLVLVVYVVGMVCVFLFFCCRYKESLRNWILGVSYFFLVVGC